MSTLSYFISKRDPILVISLKGSMTPDCEKVYEECVKEAQGMANAIVVLNFAEVQGIDVKCIRDFTLLRKSLRDSCRKLLMSGMDAGMQKLLMDKGVLGHGEVKEELADALREASQFAQQFKGSD